MATKVGGVLLAVLSLITSIAGGDPLWSIGREDNSYAEFAIAGQHPQYPTQFPESATFIVGQDDPAQKWPFIHPGPSDAWAGSRSHVFTVQFSVATPPPAACRLLVHSTNAHSVMPARLQVAVNGAVVGILAFAPGKDERCLADPAIVQPQVQSILFPASHLRAGDNTLTLTSAEGSWLLYDSLMLVAEDITGVRIHAVEAVSTPFFRRVGADLKQAVRVSIRNEGLEGDATVSIPDAPETQQQIHLQQGDNRVDLLVTPFTEPGNRLVEARSADAVVQANFEALPARQWKLYVAPSAHTDIGYTDLQERCIERHNDNTATALKAMADHPGLKWNMEVFAQNEWYRSRGDEAFQDLQARVKEGRIGITGLYLNMLTGLCYGDEMAKILQPAQDFGQALGVPVTVATLTDVPTSVGTLPMFFRHAGIKYFAEGINHDRGPVWNHADPRMVQSPFWWEGLDGSRVLAVFTRSYGQAQVIGLRDSVDVLEQKLPNWIKAIDRPDYPCDAIYGNGGFWDNEQVTPRFIEIAAEWNAKWAFPQIIVARTDEFFQYVEQNFADALPVFRGDMGSYWEDGAASSALETGMVRLAKARLNLASRREALAAAHDSGYERSKPLFDAAWNDVLFYDEHTWGAAGSIHDPKSEQSLSQWTRKATFAQRSAKQAEELDLATSKNTRAAIAKADTSYKFLTVLNECSWPRDIVVAVPGSSEATVRNLADSQAAPSYRSHDTTFFLARQVPAMGYRSYGLEVDGAADQSGILRPGSDPYTWESVDFRYRIDPKTGAFWSIEDLRTHREWVDVSEGYALNQFLHVTGGNGTSLVHPPDKPAPPLQPVSHSEAKVSLVANGPFFAVLAIERRGGGVSSVDTYCTIHADGRLDLVNVMDKQETLEKEAGYFAFPFRLEAPENTRTLHDLPYGVVEVDREQMPGACRAWYAANSFMAVTDERATACVAAREAPLFTVGTLFDGTWPAKLSSNRGTFFSYAFNNYWHTNYKASQGGRMIFSFSVKLDDGAFNPVAATRFGFEALAAGSLQNVLCTVIGPSQQARQPEESFLTLDEGPVILSELATQDDGRLLARFYNPSYAAASTNLGFPALRIAQAWKTDLFGRNGQPAQATGGRLHLSVPARGIATYVIETASK